MDATKDIIRQHERLKLKLVRQGVRPEVAGLRASIVMMQKERQKLEKQSATPMDYSIYLPMVEAM